MKTKRILTLMISVLIILACQLPGAAIGQLPDAPTAPPAADIPPLLTTGETPEPPEDPAGAVYIIPTTESRLCATVTAYEALHLRAEASETSAVLDYLHNGEQVIVKAPGAGWWKVRTAENVEGYAKAKYLQEEKCQE